MNEADMQAQFDQWAATYDADLRDPGDGFPFAGYQQNLDLIVAQAAARPGMAVLDVGVGTGNLAAPFLAAGCTVLGVDFSAEMLRRAQAKLPALRMVQVDLLDRAWPPQMAGRYERIVSNYVLHEFQAAEKVRLLDRLRADYLAPGGRVLIGDIMFANGAAQARARAAAGDAWEQEYYWLLDEMQPALAAAGWTVASRTTSFCAGVLLLAAVD